MLGASGAQRRPVQQPIEAASATARRYSLLRPGRSTSARARVHGAGTRHPRRGGRSAPRAAGPPARCAVAAPAPTTPQPHTGNGNRTAAGRAAAPARQQSPHPGGPPPASHPRLRRAPGTGTPARPPHQDHRRQPALCARYPQPEPPPASARRQSPSAQNTVRSSGPPGSPASAAGVKPSQNRRQVSSDHGPRPELGHMSCHRLLHPVHRYPHGNRWHRHQDRSDRATDQRADHPIGAAAYLTNLGCAPDHTCAGKTWTGQAILPLSRWSRST